jgi:two-component system, OmpR family, alkaline phosphatase synthesis response regulator PhoP
MEVQPMQLTKPRILYVEDHEDTRESISLLLKFSDYEVVDMDSGTTALSQAQQEHFDLYLFDSRLPDVSGEELCRKIREFDASTPILFFSGVAYEKEKQSALSCGAQGYLTKPDDMDALADTISRLIQDSRAVAH